MFSMNLTHFLLTRFSHICSKLKQHGKPWYLHRIISGPHNTLPFCLSYFCLLTKRFEKGSVSWLRSLLSYFKRFPQRCQLKPPAFLVEIVQQSHCVENRLCLIRAASRAAPYHPGNGLKNRCAFRGYSPPPTRPGPGPVTGTGRRMRAHQIGRVLLKPGQALRPCRSACPTRGWREE